MATTAVTRQALGGTLATADADAVATLAHMAELVKHGASLPVVRATAESIIATVPPRDAGNQIDALRYWLATAVHFVSDPVDIELVKHPAVLLEEITTTGQAFGDCDDAAVLGAALGESIGLPARFVALGFGTPDAPLAHVLTELWDGQAWRDLDVTTQLSETQRSPLVTRAWTMPLYDGPLLGKPWRPGGGMQGYSYPGYPATPEYPAGLADYPPGFGVILPVIGDTTEPVTIGGYTTTKGTLLIGGVILLALLMMSRGR